MSNDNKDNYIDDDNQELNSEEKVENTNIEENDEVSEDYSDLPEQETEEEQFVENVEMQDADIQEEQFVEDYVEEQEKKQEAIHAKSYDEKATSGLKTMGIISLFMAVLGLLMIGLFTYFLVLAPNYDKSKELDGDIIYPAIASYDDAELQTTMEPMISTMSDATATDASPSDATATDSDKE